MSTQHLKQNGAFHMFFFFCFYFLALPLQNHLLSSFFSSAFEQTRKPSPISLTFSSIFQTNSRKSITNFNSFHSWVSNFASFTHGFVNLVITLLFFFSVIFGYSLNFHCQAHQAINHEIYAMEFVGLHLKIYFEVVLGLILNFS